MSDSGGHGPAGILFAPTIAAHWAAARGPEPLTLAQVKPRLLGHWGTTPGLNFIYVHLNRVIKARGLDAIYVIGPGHGGPGIVANAYHRLACAIGAMATSTGGVDGLVFTGGIGEKASLIRAESCARLGFLVVEIDALGNRAFKPAKGDALVSAAGSQVAVLVISAREDVEIAREVRGLLTAS